MNGKPLIDWAWIGSHLDDIWALTVEHLVLAFVAVVVGFAISFVLALIALRWRSTYGPITAVAGLLYVIPSLALFAILVPITGLTPLTAEIALVSYTILILVRNTVSGIDGVPGRGAGSRPTAWASRRAAGFWRVELPLAMPLIVAGLRIAAVTTIGLVTVSALIGQGGLGRLINDGLRPLVPDHDHHGRGAVGRARRPRGHRVRAAAPAPDALDPGAGGTVLMLQGLVDQVGARGGLVRRPGQLERQRRHPQPDDGAPRHLPPVDGRRAAAGRAHRPVHRAHRAPRVPRRVRSPTSAAPCRRTPSWRCCSRCPSRSAWQAPSGDIAYLATFVAMVLLAVPPVVTNTYAGMQGVDRDLLEAARGMGMRGHQVLRRVELPLALPVALVGHPHRRGPGGRHGHARRRLRRWRAGPLHRPGPGT